MAPTTAVLLLAIAAGPADAPPAPVLLVVNKDDDALAIVDPTRGEVVGRVATGHVPHEVAASGDGRLAFVSNYGTLQEEGRSLSVIDPAARTEVRRVHLGPIRRPHGLAVAGGKLYFTAEASKLIGCYDPTLDRVDWLLGTGQDRTHMILASRGGDVLYTANINSGSLSLFERFGEPTLITAERWRQVVIPVGPGPEGFDVSPDGREVWAARSHDGQIAIVDVASRSVVRTFDAKARRSNRLRFTPDGKTVLVSDMDGGTLFVLDVASRRERARLALGPGVSGILIVPDGSRAYVAVGGDNHVAEVDLATLAVVRRIATGKNPDGMAWAVRR